MIETAVVKEDVMHLLGAAKAGLEVAKKATTEIQDDVSSSELRELLSRGEQQSKLWMDRVERAIAEAGEAEKSENEVLEAMYNVSKKIRRGASNDEARDLGIIANGQMALHYWIAAFGTLRAYSEQAGFPQIAQDMQSCLDDAQAADEKHTQAAAHMLGSTRSHLTGVAPEQIQGLNH